MTDTTPDLGFAFGPNDRAAHIRGDARWRNKQLGQNKPAILLFSHDRPLINVANGQLQLALFTKDQLEARLGTLEPLFLAMRTTDEPVFAVTATENAANAFIDETVKAIDVRSLAVQAALPRKDLGIVAIARSLIEWHRYHMFCSNCGAATNPGDGGHKRICPDCTREHFPRVDPVVISVVEHEDRFLLGRGPNFPENSFSTLAGFVEVGETIEAATRREIREEVGIDLGEVRYVMSHPWPFPSSLMIGMHAIALNDRITIDPNEIADARWFTKKDLVQMRDNTHPDGLILPPPMTIAWQLINQVL